SVGAAVSWQLDAKSVAFRTQLIVNWVLLDVSALLMVYLSFRIKEQGEDDESENIKDGADYKEDASAEARV
ncbi:hypothetical protein EC988_001702, partial [Linderina pennispora]